MSLLYVLSARITYCVLLVQLAVRVELSCVFKTKSSLGISGAESIHVESSRGMRLLGMRRETRRKASLWSKTTTNSVMFQILFYKENQWPYFIF